MKWDHHNTYKNNYYKKNYDDENVDQLESPKFYYFKRDIIIFLSLLTWFHLLYL